MEINNFKFRYLSISILCLAITSIFDVPYILFRDFTTLNGQVEDPCSLKTWEKYEQLNQIQLEKNISMRDFGLLYILTESESFKKERNQSIQCFQRTFEETIPIKTVFLNKNYSFHHPNDEGYSHLMHDSTLAMIDSPFNATIFLDTDVFANPMSGLGTHLLINMLENVDMAFSYANDRHHGIDLQYGGGFGVNTGFIAYRNTIFSKLFLQCVVQTFEDHEFSFKQQPAFNLVLRGPIGRKLRVRMLPSEWMCRYAKFVNHTHQECLFTHTHARLIDNFDACNEENE
jgi:hypothetical protein